MARLARASARRLRSRGTCSQTTRSNPRASRAASGKVTSPKELTAIQEEVASLKRRQVALEDDLLERMEQRETLEAELAELDERRERLTAEQAEVTLDQSVKVLGQEPDDDQPGETNGL